MKYHYEVLVGTGSNAELVKALGPNLKELKNDSASCSSLHRQGNRYQTVSSVTPADELVVAVARYPTGSPPSADNCEFVLLREGGIADPDNIHIALAGYPDEEESLVTLTNGVIQQDLTEAIKGDLRFIRLPFSQLVRYHDDAGAARRVQHGQVIRLEVTRRVQATEEAQPVDSLFHLHWDFVLRSPRVWSGFQFPTLFSLSLSGPTDWRTLPVATATGLRFGTNAEFPHYIGAMLFVAPAFKISGDAPAQTAGAGGVELDLGGYVGVGVGLNVGSGQGTHPFIAVSIGDNLRRVVASQH